MPQGTYFSLVFHNLRHPPELGGSVLAEALQPFGKEAEPNLHQDGAE